MSDWLRLDNAALIFPAVRRRDWSNAFRMSADLNETVDPYVLQRAVDELLPRFPSFFVSLRKGAFWYYLQKLEKAPLVQKDMACPLVHMNRQDVKKSCIRVLYYENRIAVEFFHVVTDGTGGIIFLKTLVAKYISIKYGVSIKAECGVLNAEETPLEVELEDSFSRAAGPLALSRKEENSVMLKGTREEDGFRNIITASIADSSLIKLAHEYSCSVTAFLSAVMIETIADIYKDKQNGRWIKITIPVNLRKIFGGNTLRNFALYVNVGVDPRLGSYSLADLCKSVKSQLETQVTKQQMAARVAANVAPSKSFLLRIMPLPIKNLALKLVYNSVGESKGSINISNLGKTELPQGLVPYVKNIDFIIGPQASYPNNCSVVSCNGVTRINLIRNIKESELEREFIKRLVDLGLEVTVQSNRKMER